MKFFDLDGPFQRYGTMVFDLIVLNLLWLLISIFSFGILIGPASAGLYSGLYASIVTGEGYAFKQFFSTFRKRFLTSFAIGLIAAIFTLISIGNLYFVWTGQFGIVQLLPVYLFVFLEISFMVSWASPMVAHTQLKTKHILRVTFFLANRHLPWTILATLVNGILGFIFLFIGIGGIQLFPVLFFGPAIAGLINSYIISKRLLPRYEFFTGLGDEAHAFEHDPSADSIVDEEFIEDDSRSSSKKN